MAETKFNARLATEVEAFLNKEQVLYWLETLSLLNALNGAPSALRVILNWIDVSGTIPSTVGIRLNPRRIIAVTKMQ